MSITAFWLAAVLSALIVTVPVVLSTTPSIATDVSAASARVAERMTFPTPVTVPSTSRSPTDGDNVTVPPASTEPAAATVTSPMLAPLTLTSPVAPKFPAKVTTSASSMVKAPTSPSARLMSPVAVVAESLSVFPPSTSPRSMSAAKASMSTIPSAASLASVVNPTPVVLTAPAEMSSVRRAADASRSRSPAVISTCSSSIVPFSATIFTATAPSKASFRSMLPDVEVNVREAFVTVTSLLKTSSSKVVMFVSTMTPPAPEALTVVLPRVFSCVNVLNVTVPTAPSASNTTAGALTSSVTTIWLPSART